MADQLPKRRLRCAIYTRKSSEEGLEQDFNSLDAQREACAAYITSQKHEGWIGLPTRYDDGGYSGGSMDRPALRQLLSDLTARKIDFVVVYKVDRLTRALADFAKIVEVFDAQSVSFVSVTQAFNTTSSMGRLTLNVLLSFAQFEREVTGERIRDKIAASKKKGLWMGGFVPFGDRANGRTLLIHEDEAAIVRAIFTRYLDLGTVREVEAELAKLFPTMQGRTTKAGRTYGTKLLSNPIYCGDIGHKGIRYPGQHPAIVSAETFASAAVQLASNGHERKIGRNAKSSSLLAGLLVDANGQKLIATHATKLGKRYRYYISRALHQGGGANQEPDFASNGTTAWRYPALEIETIAVREICSLLTDQGRLIELAKQIESNRSWSIADRSQLGRTASATAKVLNGNDPASSRAIMLTLVLKIEIGPTTVKIAFNASGMMATLGFPVEHLEPENSEVPHLSFPIAVRRRGAETKMVLRLGDHGQAEPDETMIRAVARARRWMIELVDGVHGSVVQLADAYATNANYVAKHLPLAFLAPSVVDAILEGRQPVELTTWDLMNRIDIPLDWGDQARRLGLP